MDGAQVPTHQIRAVYDDRTITVYQAYSAAIAKTAVAAQTFVSPFKTNRMTWIKPSFLWMMYRSGWATKPGQEHILAIRITRTGFEEALASASLSHYDDRVYSSREEWRARKETCPVRLQWDPERDLHLDPLPWRSLQIGLSGVAVTKYLDDWIVNVTDITIRAQLLRPAAVANPSLLPAERPYPLPSRIADAIGAEH
jgi:hypothetical protein